MKRLTEKQKLGVLIFFLVGGGGFLFYHYFFKPMTGEIKRLSADKKSKEETLLQNQREAARLPFVEALGKRLSIELSYAEEVLPKDLDVPYLLTTLTHLAEENKVYFSSFSPGGIQERQDYAIYSISLPLVGNFHNVIRFLCAIGNLPRLINTIDLSVSALGGGGGSLDTVSVPLRLESYIYR